MRIRGTAVLIITVATIIGGMAAAIGAETSTGSGVVIGTKGEILQTLMLLKHVKQSQ